MGGVQVRVIVCCLLLAACCLLLGSCAFTDYTTVFIDRVTSDTTAVSVVTATAGSNACTVCVLHLPRRYPRRSHPRLFPPRTRATMA
jgi:hypothetical protein